MGSWMLYIYTYIYIYDIDVNSRANHTCYTTRSQGCTVGVGIINELKFPEDKKKEKSSDDK